LVACAGEAAERLFFDGVAASHKGDCKELVRREKQRREQLGLPPLVDGDHQWVDEVAEETRAHLNGPEWKRLIEAVAKKLLVHESLDFGQFVGVVIEAFGAEALPDQIHYFKRYDDESALTTTVIQSEGGALDNVLVRFAGQADCWRLHEVLNGFPEGECYALDTVEGQDSIRSFLRRCAETMEHMTINRVRIGRRVAGR